MCFTDYVDHIDLWKVLKKMGIPEQFDGLIRNLYTGQEATVLTERTWQNRKAHAHAYEDY